MQDARLTAAGPQLRTAVLHTQLAQVLTGQLCESPGQVQHLKAGEVLTVVLQPLLEAPRALLTAIQLQLQMLSCCRCCSTELVADPAAGA